MTSFETVLSQLSLEDVRRGAPTPLYHQLYSALRQAIMSGRVAAGVQMPTEQQLAEAFAVSRITAKRAMDELAAENLVERRRGKGTHVVYQYEPKPVKAPLVAMLQEIEFMARHSRAAVITCRRQAPPRDVAERLGIGPGEPALHLVRVRSRDGAPFGHYESWTCGLSGNISRATFRSTPRLELFRNHGLDISHVTQTITAEAATRELAKHLELHEGAPLISLIRHSFVREDEGQRLVDVLHAHYHPGRFQYRMELELESRR